MTKDATAEWDYEKPCEICKNVMVIPEHRICEQCEQEMIDEDTRND